MSDPIRLKSQGFDALLEKRVAPGVSITIMLPSGSKQCVIVWVKWPMLWTDAGPVHASHVIELRCGEDCWERR